MPLRFRLFLAILVMPVLAVCAAIASLSTILEDVLPGQAIALPIVNGNAYATEALQHLNGAKALGPQAPRYLALKAGRRTFESEPTNSTAISLMALSHQLNGDARGARRLYEDALRVAKRDRLANLWLLEDASQNGRIGYILDRYNVLLRTGGAASDLLFDVLGTALREEAIVPHLEDRLARRPPWAEQFWLKVTPNANAIGNVGRLRLRLLQRGVENAAGNDTDILRRLADNGEFVIAFELMRRLTGNESAPRAPVRNEEFDRQSRFAPFDWETFSASGYKAEVDPKAGALVLYSEDPEGALLARQLIEVIPGRYLLRYRMADKEPLRYIRASLRARCAKAGAQEFFSMPITATSGFMAVSVPGSDCQYAWLEIWAQSDALESRPAAEDVFIDSITMRSTSRSGSVPY